MTGIHRFIAIGAAVLTASALAAEPGSSKIRSDTDFQSNFTGPDYDPVTKDPSASNWPGLPERQGGRSYSKQIHTTSGVRERNAESGRR